MMRATVAGLAFVATLAIGALLAVGGTSAPARAQTDELEPGSIERGEVLYRIHCTVCHGPEGEGVGAWPPIVDAGAASADFQLRTGRMPFSGDLGQQALRKPPAFDEQEIRDLVAYVAALGDGPPIPEVALDDDLLQLGKALFVSNCAPCHGASANGGAVGAGAIAWPLTAIEPRLVAEAMITGPGAMPVFDYPDEERNAILTYVRYLQEAESPGGFAIGGIGPVPEGFVAWLVGISLLVAIVYLIGREWGEKGGEA